jgi:hypothetical protein
VKRGITVRKEAIQDGTTRVLVEKRRGKLTFEEIREALREEFTQYGGTCFFAMIVKASEEDGYQGWMDGDDAGDTVELLQIEEGYDCPVCGRMAPPFEYCPNCGEAWRERR